MCEVKRMILDEVSGSKLGEVSGNKVKVRRGEVR